MSGKWHGGKGSRPRPFSVGMTEFNQSMDRIFGDPEREKAKEEKKKADAEYWAKLKAETAARLEEANKKTTEAVFTPKKGTCGCGRSPTGDCVGWHGLTEADYQVKLKEHNEKLKTS